MRVCMLVPVRCLVDEMDNELLLRIDCEVNVCSWFMRKSRVNEAHPSKPLINLSGN